MKPSLIQRTQKRGLSIAESLLSVFLVALLAVVLFNLLPTTVLANRQGNEQLQARSLAQSELAEIRARPFPQLTPGLRETNGPIRLQGNDYHTELLVGTPTNGDPQYMRLLTVTVRWVSNNQNKSLREQIWIHQVMED